METTTVLEQTLPQLRQMVVENTKRINRNEEMIDKVHRENVEESQKIRKLNEWCANSQKEYDRRLRIINERLDRIDERDERFVIERDNSFRELKEMFKETDKRVGEYRKESDKRIEEHRRATDREIKEMFRETNASISRISKELLGVTGHIVEGLVSSSTEKIFRKAGFNFRNSGKNLKRVIAAENKQMEVDVMLENDEVALPVEVKADFTGKKVKRFLHKMTMFRRFFPDYADKKVYAAVAAINYEDGADILAHEEGLLVIRVNSDDVFSLDPVDEKQLREF